MTLILRTVVIASLLLVSTTATPPPGYVKKQPDNDKNPASYRYDYRIQNDSGEGQAKSETRNDEHASGRYYVNSKHGSTDVAYYADDWGYHPFIKYNTADDHSSSSARLAFGEQAVESYDETPSSLTDISGSTESKSFTQVTQPYHQSPQQHQQQGIVYASDAPSAEHQSSSSGGSLSESNSLSGNYVSNPPTQTIPETLSYSAFQSSGHHQSSTTQQQQEQHQQQSNLLTSQENDLSLSRDEDQLIAENAGSFGARVRGDTSYSSPITLSPIHSSSLAPTALSTRDGRHYYYHHLHGRLHQTNDHLQGSYQPSVLPGPSYFTPTALPPASLDSGVTANSIESLAEQQHYGSGISNEFSKPIVVAEQPQRQQQKEPPFQYSTTFECEDDKSPTTPNPALLLYKDDAAASSHVLNSIQAGVALVNAGEAHLIGRAEEARLPAPVEEKIDDLDQTGQSAHLNQFTKNVGNVIQPQSTNYVGINPAFGGQENAVEQKQYTLQPQLTTQPQPQQDSLVEIQKSIEIYHSSPQHEIHYPGTLATTQVTQIDQQQPHQQQKQYFSGDADKNIKHTSESRGDINYAEITGTYSKVSGGNEPVYIVPPATYVLVNNSVQKNDNNLQNDLIQLGGQPSDAYGSEIDQQGQLLQTVPPKQEQENVYVTQPQIIEKQVPVPQIFPIAVEIPQPYPIHVEKVVEKNIPFPVHIPIPQPYPVEKIVEKVVEKKVPYTVETPKYYEKTTSTSQVSSHHHYGQHYGPSYQQVMKQQNHGLYSHQTSGQHFQRYEKPAFNVKANHEHNPFLKKHSYNSYLPPKSNSLVHRRHAAVQRPSDFIGPPPLQRHHQQQQQQHTFQTKKSFASRPTISSLRRARNHDPPRHQKGNFRQSKIEYGFKPPMAPSVQYDEESASKVES